VDLHFHCAFRFRRAPWLAYMLDSLVRVSRRVGWGADRFATDPERHRERTGSGRGRVASPALQAVPSTTARRWPGARAPGRGLARQFLGREQRAYGQAGCTGARRHLPSCRPSGLRATGRGAPSPESAPARLGSGAGGRVPIGVREIPRLPQCGGPVEYRGGTLRSHPFAYKRFHVLLNSLFKVLFNFPSRYLSAIGLVTVFSLRWSLPPALGCIPKQPDSEDDRRRAPRRR
jgi:hypothetical protein